MPVGRPAVPVVRQPTQREIEGALGAIRERLRALDAEVTRLGQVSSTNSLSTTVAALQANIQALNRRVTQLELQIGVTDVVALTAAEAIAAGDAVVMSGESTCAVLDPADPTRIFACVGLAQDSVSAGQSVNVQRRGSFTIPVGALEAGRAVYAKLGGGLTQDPSYADYAVPVGAATSTTTLWVAPGEPALLTAGIYSTAFDDPVPVSYGLLRQQLGSLEQLIELLNAGENGYVIIYQGSFGVDPNGGGGGGGGGVSDGNYGDITVSGGGLVWTINASTVTLAKMADLPAGTLIGNDTGAPGVPKALTAAEAKALLDIDAADVAGLSDAVLSAISYALTSGRGITIAPNSAGVLEISADAGTFTNSSTAPAFPGEGDRWFDPDDGILYTYVDGVWVEL